MVREAALCTPEPPCGYRHRRTAATRQGPLSRSPEAKRYRPRVLRTAATYAAPLSSRSAPGAPGNSPAAVSLFVHFLFGQAKRKWTASLYLESPLPVIARPVRSLAVAIRSLSRAPAETTRLLGDCGLPRRFAPRNDQRGKPPHLPQVCHDQASALTGRGACPSRYDPHSPRISNLKPKRFRRRCRPGSAPPRPGPRRPAAPGPGPAAP